MAHDRVLAPFYPTDTEGRSANTRVPPPPVISMDWKAVETLKLASGPCWSNGKLESVGGYFC
jgi:hypothetical protein